METTQLIIKYFICYSGFFILSWLAKGSDGNKLLDVKGPVRNSKVLVGLQVGGILWMGVVPFFIFKQSFGDLVWGDLTAQLWSYAVFFVLIMATIFIAVIQSKKDVETLFPKKISFQTPEVLFIVQYSLVRFIFLCVYEIFFRGLLLTDCINLVGIPLAVAINIILYALIHAFSGKKEIIGCIPFGLALCGVSILFHAVWPAIVLHLALSFTYEVNALRRLRYSPGTPV